MKRTAFKRKPPVAPKPRKPMPRASKPIKARSKRTTSEQDARAECRRIVLSRDLVCRGQRKTPADCTGRSTDVHELKRGKARRECYLVPERCIGLCRPCHDWVTANPEQAVELGLAKWSWEDWDE